jgi:hypothetical protein
MNNTYYEIAERLPFFASELYCNKTPAFPIDSDLKEMHVSILLSRFGWRRSRYAYYYLSSKSVML